MVNLEIHVIPVKAKRLSDDTAANSTGPNFSEWITSKKDLEISGRVWGCLKTAYKPFANKDKKEYSIDFTMSDHTYM